MNDVEKRAELRKRFMNEIITKLDEAGGETQDLMSVLEDLESNDGYTRARSETFVDHFMYETELDPEMTKQLDKDFEDYRSEVEEPEIESEEEINILPEGESESFFENLKKMFNDTKKVITISVDFVLVVGLIWIIYTIAKGGN